MIFLVGILALIFVLSAIRKIADWLYIKYPVVNGVITNINAQVAMNVDEGFKFIKIDVEYDYKGRSTFCQTECLFYGVETGSQYRYGILKENMLNTQNT